MYTRTLVRLLVAVLAVCVALTATAPRADAQFSVADPAAGENFHVELGAMWWSPDPGIVIGSGDLSALGPNGVDFVQEFGIKKARFTEFRAVLRAGKYKFRFAKVPMRYQEQAVLQRTIAFAGRQFDVTANTSADLRWDLWRAGLEYDFVKMDRGLIGFIVEVKNNMVTADLRATSAAGNVSTLSEAKAPIPTIGAIARVYPHKYVGITAEFTGFKAPGFIRDRFMDATTFEANFRDLDVYATASITRFFGVQGGYRRISADYIVDDDSGDLKMSGTYFGALVRF
jgi:hypothetical protein